MGENTEEKQSYRNGRLVSKESVLRWWESRRLNANH